jgi:hypothetical protein
MTMTSTSRTAKSSQRSKKAKRTGKMSYLYGSRFRDWWRLLIENRFRLSPRYLPRALAITLLTMANSGMSRRERRLEARAAVERVEVEDPLFILGHWRSGTTHLQYLLSQDPSLATPSTYDVTFPNTCLGFEATHGKLVAPLVPARRPQDNMALSLAAPNEDEIALAALGLPTPYLALAFPHREAHYQRFLTMADATREERRAFEVGFDGYLRKLTCKYRRPLLLKSPPHTARIAMLLEMYPSARFVHIVRDPVDVFRSTRHLYRTWYACFGALQTRLPKDPDEREALLEDRIITTYEVLYDAFLEQVGQIPGGRFHALRFEDLERDPLGELDALYRALSLRGFPEARFRCYLDGLGGYRKNTYHPLRPALHRRLGRSWGRFFRAFGYASDSARASRARPAAPPQTPMIGPGLTRMSHPPAHRSDPPTDGVHRFVGSVDRGSCRTEAPRRAS